MEHPTQTEPVSDHDRDWARAHTLLRLAHRCAPLPDLSHEKSLTEADIALLTGPHGPDERFMWSLLAQNHLTEIDRLHRLAETNPAAVTNDTLTQVDTLADYAIEALIIWLSLEHADTGGPQPDEAAIQSVLSRVQPPTQP